MPKMIFSKPPMMNGPGQKVLILKRPEADGPPAPDNTTIPTNPPVMELTRKTPPPHVPYNEAFYTA